MLRARRRWAIAAAVLLCFGISCTSAAAVASTSSALGWSPVNGSSLPTPTFGFNLVYDDATGQLLAYEPPPSPCDTGSPLWSWDGGSWTHLSAPAPVAGLTDPVLSYDGATEQVVLFGGYQYGCGVNSGHDVGGTWAWNGIRWTQLHPARSPAPGGGGCAAYDAVHRQVVMFGLIHDDPSANPQTGDPETWTWDGSTWTAHSASPAPQSPAVECSMAFDEPSQTVMLTTFPPTEAPIETWAWDGSNWSQFGASGPETIVGDTPAIAYDPSLGHMVTYQSEMGCPRSGFFFGDCLMPVSDTWAWGGGSWALQPTPSAPTPGAGGPLAYDAGTKQLVMATGPSQNGLLSNPWVYSEQGAAAIAPRRLAGSDRDSTAAVLSDTEFPGAGSASAAVLADDNGFADALVGGPLAAAEHGPLLLTPSPGLSPATAAELTRVLAPGATVYLVGGTTALSATVEQQVTALGFAVHRIAGADRYATAVAVANTLGNPSTVLEASGLNFPDAVSAAPAASARHGVVLLTAGSTQASATTAYLSAHPGSHYTVGGAAAQADPNAIALVGADRYATSAAVARAFFPNATAFATATGLNFPDALAAGAYCGNVGGVPLLLVPPTGAIPGPVQAYLTTHRVNSTGVDVVGGESAISGSVLTAIAATLTSN